MIEISLIQVGLQMQKLNEGDGCRLLFTDQQSGIGVSVVVDRACIEQMRQGFDYLDDGIVRAAKPKLALPRQM